MNRASTFVEHVARIAEESAAVVLVHASAAPARRRSARARAPACPGIGMQGRSASPSANPRPVASTVPPSMSSANIEPGRGMPRVNTPAMSAAIDALAALDRIQVVHERVEEPDLGMIGEKALELGFGGAGHKGLGVYYFRRRYSAGRRSICRARERPRKPGKSPELGPAAAASRLPSRSGRTPSSCGLMATLARVAGAGP